MIARGERQNSLGQSHHHQLGSLQTYRSTMLPLRSALAVTGIKWSFFEHGQLRELTILLRPGSV